MYRWCKSLFLPNNDTKHLMPSTDTNIPLSHLHQANLFSCGSFNASMPSWSNYWLVACKKNLDAAILVFTHSIEQTASKNEVHITCLFFKNRLAFWDREIQFVHHNLSVTCNQHFLDRCTALFSQLANNWHLLKLHICEFKVYFGLEVQNWVGGTKQTWFWKYQWPDIWTCLLYSEFLLCISNIVYFKIIIMYNNEHNFKEIMYSYNIKGQQFA